MILAVLSRILGINYFIVACRFDCTCGILIVLYLSIVIVPDYKPYEIPGNGDGTVNIRSLEGWRRWVGKQKQFVNGTGRPGVNHMTILTDKYTITEIVRHSLGVQ